MIEQQTTFILGAGSSKDFGYPTGAELRDILLNLNSSRSLVEGVFPSDIYQRFCNEFRDSKISSIDRFLELSPKHTDIGRGLIAFVIMRLNKEERVAFNKSGGWLEYLYNDMLNGCNTIKDFAKRNKTKFITFNYDFSLETFFYRALTSTFKPSTDELKEVFHSLEIIHIHGRIMGFPWEPNRIHIDDEVLLNGTSISGMQQCLQFIHERDEQIQVVQPSMEINNIFKTTGKIVFLGFGFHERNLEKLFYRIGHGDERFNLRDKPTVANVFNLKEGEVQHATNLFSTKVGMIPGDCLALLKERKDWLLSYLGTR